MQDAFIGSPVTFRWVRTNADTQVFTIIDVQGALTGSPVTFRWVRTNADAYSLALKPSHGHISNLIADAWRVNAVWVTALPTYRESTSLHEFRQRRMGSLIAGRRTTSSQILALSSSLPTLPIATLPASLAGIGFTMTEALPSISWRPTLPPPPEEAHLDLQASLTLPTLPATPPKSATPNQGLPTSTSSEPSQRSLPTSAPLMPYGQPCLQHPHPKCRRDNLITGTRNTSSKTSAPLAPYGRPFRLLQHRHRRRDKLIASTRKTSLPTSAPSMPYGRPFRQHRHRHRRRDKIIAGTQKNPLPTSAPSMLYGQPFHHHLHYHRRRDNLIAGTHKTSSPTSAPSMPYSQPLRQHLHRHRRRDKLIASMRKTSSPTSAPTMLYGRSRCQHLYRQLLSTQQSMLRGQYHRWRQRLRPHRRHKPNQFVHGANLKTLAKLATVLVGECVNTRLVPFRSLTSLQWSAGSL